MDGIALTARITGYLGRHPRDDDRLLRRRPHRSEDGCGGGGERNGTDV